MTINITATTPTTANSEEITGAAMVVRALADQGAEVLFGYPGGAALPIYDALLEEPRLRHILVRHEQGAAHAAEDMRGRAASRASFSSPVGRARSIP